RGSLGIDLAAAVDVTITTTAVHKIPTGVKGPIYDINSAIGALLIGRSSAVSAGLIVLPGVIDADYTGEIMIAAFTLTPPLVITKGTRLAQLVIYTKACELGGSQKAPIRGDRGFGSTGNTIINLVQKMQQRPMVSLQLQCDLITCRVQAMMDTGADVTIIS
ncbi:POK9 protein, partial [Atlantisia rogersi]|nr:POK9 protein [Atlantisia rogersi]